MKSRRYAIATWRVKKPKTFWKDSEKRKWEELFRRKLILILTELNLEEKSNVHIAKNMLLYITTRRIICIILIC